MRVLHTADWHMNDALGHVDRSVDVCRALERIAGYLDERDVDVLLVAGDLFSERSRIEQLRGAVAEIKRIFGPFLARGGTMVAISGNHDNEAFFETLRDAFDLVAPGHPGPGEADATGRLYVAARPRALRLADRHGCVVQLVLMPYPTARVYLRGEAGQYRTIEEKHRAIQNAFVATLRSFEGALDPVLPRVLVSHVHVRGVQAHPLYRMSEGDDVTFEPSDIPAHWAYVAYGHIHRPQPALRGAEHVRYAGSVERLDANEREDEKSVVLCDVGPSGLVGRPELLPLDATPIYHLEIADPATQIPDLARAYPDAQRALVTYLLHWRRGRDDRDALCRAIQTVFPRWYRRDFLDVGRAEVTGALPPRLSDPVTTVRAYLEAGLVEHQDRAELLGMAEQLLGEEGWR